MERSKLRWSLWGFALSLLLGVGGSAVAVEPENDQEVLFNSEFMIMDAFGADIRAFELKLEETSGNSSTSTTSLDSDVDFGWRGDLQWKNGAWGAGISGFHFDNESDASVFAPNDAASEEISLRGGIRAVDCRGDDDDDSGNCIGEANAELEVWMVDLYGIRELVDTPNVGVDLQFGMRIAELDQVFDAFVAEVDDPDAAGRLPIIGDDPHAVNSLSEADDPLVGPFLSLLSTGRFGRFRVEGQLTQAVLFGDWTATAVAPQIRGAFLDSLTTEETAVLSSDETVAIPVTDIRIKLGYDILDNLTFGFGGYATTWFNVPSVPNSRADQAKGLSVSTFQNDEENLTFLGASFSLQYVFSGGNIMPSLPSWR